MIDAHCHISQFPLKSYPKLKGIIAVTESFEDAKETIKTIKSIQNYMQIKLCLGIHPVQNGSCVAPSNFNHDDLLRLITTTENVVGIGECGLDFQPCIVSSTHPRFKPNVLNDLKNIQKLVFQGQIEIAKSLNLPLNIHSRNAGHHAIQQVLENNSQSSLFHAFDGKYTYALNAVQKGK